MKTKKIIIFVHGFGVKKDARGIFTDIEMYFSENEKVEKFEYMYIDLNKIDTSAKKEKIVVNPLSLQANILNETYGVENTKQTGSFVEYILICHSQGCVVASLANMPNIKKVFFLAPPTNNDMDRTVERFRNRPNSILNLKGDSIFSRSDGSQTLVPKEYWEDRQKINYIEEYEKFAKTNDLTIILAKNDEIVDNQSKVVLEKLGQVTVVEGNHNFDGYRSELADLLLIVINNNTLG